MNLVDYAFITLSEVKEALELSGTEHDARLNGYINRATDMIETYCKRRFLSTAYTNEVYSAQSGSTLQLRNFPVTSLGSLEYSTSDFNNTHYDAVDTSLYALQTSNGLDRGVVYLTGGFSTGINNWRATYTAGYALANVPNDLKEALIEIVSYLFNRRKATPGMKSETLGRYSYTLDSAMPGTSGLIEKLGIDTILDSYRTITV